MERVAAPDAISFEAGIRDVQHCRTREGSVGLFYLARKRGNHRRVRPPQTGSRQASVVRAKISATCKSSNCLSRWLELVPFFRTGSRHESGRISCGCSLCVFMTWQWTPNPRIAGKALRGQNDNELWKSVKADTLSYTLAHSSFSMKREESHKLVVKSGTCK